MHRLYECISVVLVFRHILLESGHYRFVEALGLVDCLRVTHCCRKVFNTKKVSKRYKKYERKQCAIVCEKEEDMS